MFNPRLISLAYKPFFLAAFRNFIKEGMMLVERPLPVPSTTREEQSS